MKKNKKQSLYYELVFTAFGVVGGALFGALYAGTHVLLFEQSESGRYAVYQKCVDAICYVGHGDQTGGDCNCKSYEEVAVPLGQRIVEQSKYYAFLWGAIGFAPGLIMGNFLWNRKRKKEEFAKWDTKTHDT